MSKSFNLGKEKPNIDDFMID